MRNIGIYSGTFDPIHEGHVAFAEAVRDTLQLSEVVFYPEPTPRNKQQVTDINERCNTIKARLRTTINCSVSVLGTNQFTIDATLPELQHRYHSAKLTILMGSDVASSLANWPNIDTLLQSCNLAIGMREGDDETVLRTYLDDIVKHFKASPTISFHRTDWHHMRSSHLREALTTDAG